MTNETVQPVRPASKLSIRKRLRRLPGARTGASALELALVAPFVFLLLFGSFEFARVMAVNQALTNAARVSCRKATLATTNDPELARQLAYDSMCGLVPNPGSNSSLIVTISPATLQGLASGTTVTTTVEVPVEEITWLPPVFLSGAKIQATASGRRE